MLQIFYFLIDTGRRTRYAIPITFYESCKLNIPRARVYTMHPTAKLSHSLAWLRFTFSLWFGAEHVRFSFRDGGALSRFLDRIHTISANDGRHLDITRTSLSSPYQLTLLSATTRASPALRPAPHCAGANRRAVPVYSPGCSHSGMSCCHIPRGSSQPSYR